MFILLCSSFFISHQFCLVPARSPGVAIRVEQKLREAMDGHKGFELSMRLDKVHNGLDLRF